MQSSPRHSTTNFNFVITAFVVVDLLFPSISSSLMSPMVSQQPCRDRDNWMAIASLLLLSYGRDTTRARRLCLVLLCLSFRFFSFCHARTQRWDSLVRWLTTTRSASGTDFLDKPRKCGQRWSTFFSVQANLGIPKYRIVFIRVVTSSPFF